MEEKIYLERNNIKIIIDIIISTDNSEISHAIPPISKIFYKNTVLL